MVQYRVGRTAIEFTSKSFLFYYSKDIYRLEPTFSLLSYLSRLIINMGRIISASRERLENFPGKNIYFIERFALFSCIIKRGPESIFK